MAKTTDPTLDNNPPSAREPQPALARTMGLGALVIYGVGDMLGSGVYALMGEAAGVMGNAVWLAFAASMVAALLTGLSYASLGSRYPRAAGAAYVTHRAFGRPFVSYMVGLAVMASGLTSMATACRAFSGYFTGLVPAGPAWVVVLAFIALLTLINFWGMRQSTWLNAVCTTVEIGGLVVVVAVGARYWGGVNYLEGPKGQTLDFSAVSSLLVLQGAVLAFYSFVGFEDMLNVCEEVKEPRKTFPRGLILALLITTAIYMAVSITAVSVVPHGELAGSKNSLVMVVQRAAPRFPPAVFTCIALFAIANTALINYIMGSRLVYGMSRQGLLPAVLGKVHPTRRTPHVAIFVLMLVVTALALAGDVRALASSTSLLLLTCFVAVNGALIVLKRRPGEPEGGFEVPSFVPALGMLVCGALIAARVTGRNKEGQLDWKAPAIAAAMLAGIALLFLVTRPKGVTEEALAAAEGD